MSQRPAFLQLHAYPYYPNFISDQPSYRSFSDGEGPNSYSGYLNDLKNHYSAIPLVIGEFRCSIKLGQCYTSLSAIWIMAAIQKSSRGKKT